MSLVPADPPPAPPTPDPGLLGLVLEQAGVGIVAVDAAGTVRVCNAEGERQYGVTWRAGRPFEPAPGFAALDLDGTALAADALPLARALRGEVQRDVRFRMQHPDGTVVTLAGVATPLRGADGSPSGAALYTRDVSDADRLEADRIARLAERRLALAEERIRRMFESPMMGFLFSRVDGTVVDANQAFLRMIGYERVDLLAGRIDWRALTPPEWADASANAVRQLQETGFITPFEKEYFRRDGGRVPALIAATHIPEEGINVTFVLDISERKRMEAALREQTRVARSITDNATVGLVMMDDRQHCTFMNPAAEKLFGFTMEQVRALDRPLHDIVHHQHPDGTHYPIEDCPIDRALPTRMQETGEDVFVRPDGTFYPVAFTASPLLADGRPVGTVIEVWDTSEEKQAEAEREALLARVRASEAQLRALVDNLPGLAFSCNAVGEVVYYNPRWEQYTGAPMDRVYTDGWESFHHPDHIGRVLDAWRRSLADGTPFQMEFPLRAADGSYRWHLGRVLPLRDGDGRVDQWFGSCTDIDESKRAAMEMEKLATIIEQTSDFVGVSTLDGRLTYTNDAGRQMLGITAEGDNPTTAADLFHPDDMEFVQAHIAPAMAAHGRWQGELRFRDQRTGSYVPIDYNVFVIRHPETGEPFAAASVTRDITEKKQAARQLQELYEREQRAARVAEHERSRLMRLLAELPAGVAVSWGPEHRFDWGNGIYREVAGRVVDGKTVREAFPDLAGQPFFDMLDMVYATGTPVHGKEAPVVLDRGKGGGTENTWFDFVYQPIFDWRGKVEGILTFCIEVTDQVVARKRVEDLAAELRRSEEQLRAVSETIPQMVFTIDPGGTVDFTNQRLLTFFGKSREQVQQSGWVDAIHPSDRDHVLGTWQASMASGQAFELEYRIRRYDGAWMWHLSRTIAVRDDSGNLSRWFGTLTDISEQKRAAAERERLIAALERSNKELDQFAYVASHDLKAPLRGIANLSQWIEEDLADRMTDEARSQMAMLRGRVQRLEGLINGILAYSRAGRVKEKIERVDLGGLLSEVRELLAPPPGAVFEFPDGLPAVVTERIPLQQVFMNLVNNGFKYSKRDDAVVSVGIADAGTFWEFSVTDNGPGIAPEYHDRIWVIFQTLAARDKVEGTGIGLSVVRKIVESKGGRAWVDSEPGKGATFRFTWPKREIGES